MRGCHPAFNKSVRASSYVRPLIFGIGTCFAETGCGRNSESGLPNRLRIAFASAVTFHPAKTSTVYFDASLSTSFEHLWHSQTAFSIDERCDGVNVVSYLGPLGEAAVI